MRGVVVVASSSTECAWPLLGVKGSFRALGGGAAYVESVIL